MTNHTSHPRTLVSADGTRFAAFAAVPERSTGAGVLVLPDNRGLSGFYEQFCCRLAEQGHPAVAVDYYGRTAGTDHRGRGPDFGELDQLMSHLRALTRPGLDADFTAAIDWLRSPTGGACQRVLSVGFCLGGRFAFTTAAPRFGLAGVIGFYGAVQPLFGAPGPTQLAAEFRAPVLGLFGGADEGIPAGEVAAFADALTEAGVSHEIVTYPGAPHGFFELGRADLAAACADAWQRVLAMLAEPEGLGRPDRAGRPG
ncbi:dienelactone hydrolase family protein [Goodfellowiella coeruleoviolacea]|uniref:dienelactone hydrolase family protein n=1 Tax=Goodfellowiella coeruleoviolacea TaxID=334858 RepID=UPI0020A3C8EC|nr:dienelactone hydrolase family protein [Goodfellowiella coeruleoviolacea]